MDHNDHVNLLKPAQLSPGGTWADFGAGSGAFTLALRELVGPQARIFAVDKDGAALKELQRNYAARFGDTSNLQVVQKAFFLIEDFPALDGIVMANSLHFVAHKERLLKKLHTFLKPGGALLLVEYNVDSGNLWVPYPLSFESWRALAPRTGFSEPRLLATHPSRFLHEIYSAVCYREEI